MTKSTYIGKGRNPNSIEALRIASTSRRTNTTKVSVYLRPGILDMLDALDAKNRSLIVNEALELITDMGLIEKLKKRLLESK